MESSFSKMHNFFVILVMMPVGCFSGAKYSTIFALFEEKLGTSSYNPEIRPVLDHSTVLGVGVSFSLNNIIDIDDVTQTMTINGYFEFSWEDEVIGWNPEDHGGQNSLQPQPKQIWRPRMMVTNSLEGRDPFQDLVEPIIAFYYGLVSWRPGLLVPTSCQLNMDKYPFDTQYCYIEICPMNYFSDTLVLVNLSSEVNLPFYVPSQTWDLLSTNVEMIYVPAGQEVYVSCMRMNLELKRRTMYFLINIVLPAVMLSFLNIFVFIIPVDSGEKISFGITVLLALTVYLSTISSMIPRASITVPAVSTYLFSLLVGSVLSVIMAIVVVALHDKDQNEEKHLETKANYQHAMTSFSNVRHAIQSMKGRLADRFTGPIPSAYAPGRDTQANSIPTVYAPERAQKKRKALTNRYRILVKYIDIACFIVFTILWIFATLWYFIYVLV